jgi:RNA ligase (TIGR02306 family)
MSEIGLVYTGKVIDIELIEGADFIACATVVCGMGGKWKGVVRKSECNIGLLVTVYLPDALITPEHAQLYGMTFMKSTNYRVKMRRFKGAPSEVVIMPFFPIRKLFFHEEKKVNVVINAHVGFDCTEILEVTKYHKPVPANLQGKVKGPFPDFIPKTDEPNYQNCEGQEYLERLTGKPYYITEKADGSSTTAFKYKGQFGICSRNWELEKDENNGYWKVAIQHQLESRLPDGYALQWETCGPKIQGNPMDFTSLTGLAFSAYNIEERCYLEMNEFIDFCTRLKFPMVSIIFMDQKFIPDGIETRGEGKYPNGKEREGIVVRSQTNQLGHKPISFKVINLNYEK